jgi:hypothetical protein
MFHKVYDIKNLGLGHQMDLAFAGIDLGQNKGRGRFLNFIVYPPNKHISFVQC